MRGDELSVRFAERRISSLGPNPVCECISAKLIGLQSTDSHIAAIVGRSGRAILCSFCKHRHTQTYTGSPSYRTVMLIVRH